MRLILEERELIHLRKILISIVMKRYQSSAFLFSAQQYKEWAYEIVDEGICEALRATDWHPERAKEASPSSLLGLKVWYIYLKTRNIARRELRREFRYRKLNQSLPEGFSEEAPFFDESFDLTLTRLDIENAFPKLSQDQRAAFALVHFADVPIEEAAVILKRSRGALDMLLTRARKVIGESLQATVSKAPVPRTKRGRPRKQQHLRAQKGDEEPRSSIECV